MRDGCTPAATSERAAKVVIAGSSNRSAACVDHASRPMVYSMVVLSILFMVLSVFDSVKST